MKFNSKSFKITTSIIFLPLLIMSVHTLKAQTTPTFWVTWEADSYTPTFFGGKALPTQSSNITVAFELVENGKVLSLANQEVRWSIDDAMVSKGSGLKTFSYRASANTSIIRIDLPRFRGGTTLSKSIQIPVANPEVVVSAKGYISAGRDVNLRAMPYFFNASRLSDFFYNWKVNGTSPDGNPANPELLTVSIPAEAGAGDKIIAEVQAATYGEKISAFSRKILIVQ